VRTGLKVAVEIHSVGIEEGGRVVVIFGIIGTTFVAFCAHCA
jgi:hypothetical protein